MPDVAIVTDTTHYLSPAVAAGLDVHEVSLYVNWPDVSERESEMDGFDAFYERLRAMKDIPTTSQPSIGDFLEVYEPLVQAGRPIVSLHLSGQISGTVEAARQAAEQLGAGGNRVIEVVDSLSAAGGMALQLLAAVAAARSGAETRDVVARIERARETSKVWFAVDTLDFLQRGGRIGKAQGLLGSALRIKPILTIEGEIAPIEKVRTASRAFDRMVEYLRSRHEDGADGWMIQHIRSPDQAARLADAGREIFGTEPVDVSEIGPVMGAHAGPGLLAVGGCPRSLLS